MVICRQKDPTINLDRPSIVVHFTSICFSVHFISMIIIASDGIQAWPWPIKSQRIASSLGWIWAIHLGPCACSVHFLAQCLKRLCLDPCFLTGLNVGASLASFRECFMVRMKEQKLIWQAFSITFCTSIKYLPLYLSRFLLSQNAYQIRFSSFIIRMKHLQNQGPLSITNTGTILEMSLALRKY